MDKTKLIDELLTFWLKNPKMSFGELLTVVGCSLPHKGKIMSVDDKVTFSVLKKLNGGAK